MNQPYVGHTCESYRFLSSLSFCLRIKLKDLPILNANTPPFYTTSSGCVQVRVSHIYGSCRAYTIKPGHRHPHESKYQRFTTHVCQDFCFVARSQLGQHGLRATLRCPIASLLPADWRQKTAKNLAEPAGNQQRIEGFLGREMKRIRTWRLGAP